MSYAGRVLGMITRDKENRELRKNLKNRRKENLSKAVLGKKIDYSKVTPSDLEGILKKTEEKKQNDSIVLNQKLLIWLAISMIIGGIIIYVFRKAGIL